MNPNDPNQATQMPSAGPLPPPAIQPEAATMPGTAQQPAAAAQPTASPQAAKTIPAGASQTNPNSTQNVLQIVEIRDGIVIMNDGSFRSVVMVKSVNFDLMSAQEQESVEFSYQKFLNSLYFPIQIFMHSQRVDLRPYVEKLEKIRSQHDNMLLAMLIDDYVGYIDQLSQQTNIMDKTFYVVVPYFPGKSLEDSYKQKGNFFSGLAAMFSTKEQHVTINEQALSDAKNELRNRVQAVLGGLLPCGVQGLPLDTQELIELYYDIYNPDTATRQQMTNFNNLTADVITKAGEGGSPPMPGGIPPQAQSQYPAGGRT